MRPASVRPMCLICDARFTPPAVRAPRHARGPVRPYVLSVCCAWLPQNRFTRSTSCTSTGWLGGRINAHVTGTPDVSWQRNEIHNGRMVKAHQRRAWRLMHPRRSHTARPETAAGRRSVCASDDVPSGWCHEPHRDVRPTHAMQCRSACPCPLRSCRSLRGSPQ